LLVESSLAMTTETRLSSLCPVAVSQRPTARIATHLPALATGALVGGFGDHPLIAMVRALDAEQRRIAGALALSQVALPRNAVLRLGANAGNALDELVTRLIADEWPDAGYTVPALMRHAILRELDAATLDEIRAALVEALADSDLPAAAVVQESARHLRALGLPAETLHAAECGADPNAIPARYDLPTHAARAPDALATSQLHHLVIDGQRHEVVDGAVRVVLTSRIVLRQLLYAFVISEGYFLDHVAICRALWRCDYAPLRHNSSLKSNIRRLRELLKGTRAVIQTEHHGYRLSVPPDSVLLPPA
jgi:hypothetical protein